MRPLLAGVVAWTLGAGLWALEIQPPAPSVQPPNASYRLPFGCSVAVEDTGAAVESRRVHAARLPTASSVNVCSAHGRQSYCVVQP